MDPTYTFFKHKKQMLSIDATNSDCLARLVNDSPFNKSNCKMEVVEVDGRPHLCLFSIREISPYEELRYDYGVGGLEWRKVGTFIIKS
ncbi:histone-lysine N-methyltransferase set-1-like [Hydractinia symbiolongicarpus]|uniref:histone-lysine N-methyltransferase set-1-like n=1 Tax=Hydractinia symbiolongicarpus TaxID=13093 RepID=UPI00254FCA50|nr:histone-lysine N-methyltransferase set-1-like [Hydractinia symbiolongicarpus]